VLNGHQQLKYDFSKETNWPGNNILVVQKERQESDSALTSIINMYLKKNAVRNHDFYFSEIGINQEGYTYREQKIEKIVFLFDTLQSGTSTIRNLKFYFEEYSKTSLDNVQNQHIIYYCKGMEIKLETIIENYLYRKKLFKYRTAGVRGYWIVDPINLRVTVFHFEHDTFEEYSFLDKVKVGIYDDFEIDFSQISLK